MRKKGESDAASVTRGTGAEAPGKARQGRAVTSTGVGKFMTGGALFLAAVIGAGVLLLGWLQFGRHQDLADQAIANLLATRQSILISEHIGYARKLTERIAASDLVAESVDVSGSGALAARLAQLLPGAEVVLIPPGQVLVPEGLSFSARELIAKSRDSNAVQLVIAPGQPPVLYLAGQTPAMGVVLLTWELERLAALLAKQDIGNASMQVSLANGGPVLFSTGPAATVGQEVAITSENGLQVRVVVPRAGGDPALMVLFAGIGGAMLALAVLIFISTLLAVGRSLRKDSALLTHLAQDLINDPKARPRGKFTFDVLGLCLGSLRKLAERSAAGAAPRRVPPPAMGFGDNLDKVIGEEDEGLLVVEEPARQSGPQLPAEIFREYDIRGEAGKNLSVDTVKLLGQAIGTEALQAGQQTVVVARDGRLSSPALCDALIQGLIASGRDVIDIGMAPTPVLHYATKILDTRSGVCVTGSHNPPAENGLKITVADETLFGERINALRQRVARGELATGQGKVTRQDVSARYLEDVVNDIVLARPVKVVVDCANGVAGGLAPQLLRQLGCEVVELFSDIDGNFPNHAPDTSDPATYEALKKAVVEAQAEIGIALDGDGDRIGVVTPAGEIIWPDRLMMLFARDLLTRSPGADVLFDVKCSRELPKLISEHGGRPLMWKTGHSLIKAKLRETGAPLAGEMSGHIFFADRWHGFDDGLYAAGRLLEILSLESGDAAAVFATLQTGVTTPELRIPIPEQAKFALVEKLKAQAQDFAGGTPVTVDGLRVDYEDGWGLVRASNTGPLLIARFEGRDQAALERIQAAFRTQLLAINPQMKLPF